MPEVTFDSKAYAKMILHTAKYPHCAVNGVLLANAPEGEMDLILGPNIDIVDAVPLFHHSHYVTPMAEVALSQV